MRTLLPLIFKFLCLYISVSVFFSCNSATRSDTQEWESIFNGKNFDNWDIKIAGHTLGDNYKNTFSIQDSMMRISYQNYTVFDNQFGHIYYKPLLSYYKIRFQYRFNGEHLSDAPSWSNRNSGIMLHSQSAETLNLNQTFPVSLEMQLLGGLDTGITHTGNLCTPGTIVQINNLSIDQHCTSSNSKTYYGNRWVSAEVEVYGDSLIRHIIEGQTVLEYQHTKIGGGFVDQSNNWSVANITDSSYWLNKAGSPLQRGQIAFQAESQDVDFRRIELLQLEGCTDSKAKNYKRYYIKTDNSKCIY